MAQRDVQRRLAAIVSVVVVGYTLTERDEIGTHGRLKTRFTRNHLDEEDAAQEAGRGLLAGAFVMPWEWRRGKRLR